MNAPLLSVGCAGMGFCAFMSWLAWNGTKTFPLVGGIFGPILTPLFAHLIEPMKRKNRPDRRDSNVEGMVFWGFCCLIWLAVILTALLR